MSSKRGKPLDMERQMMRQGTYEQAYKDAVRRAEDMNDAEVKAAAVRAAGFVERNYNAGKKLAAAQYEGKVAGYRYALQQRRQGNAK